MGDKECSGELGAGELAALKKPVPAMRLLFSIFNFTSLLCIAIRLRRKYRVKACSCEG